MSKCSFFSSDDLDAGHEDDVNANGDSDFEYNSVNFLAIRLSCSLLFFILRAIWLCFVSGMQFIKYMI
jgi:hypothetical protein